MIKSLLGEDEEPKKEESKPEIIGEQEKFVKTSEKNAEVLSDVSKSEIDTQNDVSSEKEVETEDKIETIDEIKTAIETGNIPQKNTESVQPFEVKRPIGQPPYESSVEEKTQNSVLAEENSAKSERELELERKLAEIEAELLAEKEYQNKISEESQEQNIQILEAEQVQRQKELENLVQQSAELSSEKGFESTNTEVKTDDSQKINISYKDFKPESKAEIIRKSGLAWSAAIALFGSIVFMLILGWFADLLLDSSPWGITVGIILGAIIGFLQFFRMTSQIINPKPNDFERVSLYSNLEESKPKTEVGTQENQASEEKIAENSAASLAAEDEIKPKEDTLN